VFLAGAAEALTVFFSGGAEAFEGAAEPLAVAEL
jgi:hypothetical protein